MTTEQLAFNFDDPGPEIRKLPAGEDRTVIGGIYMDNNDEEYDGKYAVSFGKAFHFLFEGMDHIDSMVEIGGNHSMVHLPDYCLSIDKLNKQWRVKDTGYRNCKHILAHGRYEEGFEESMKPYMKAFMK